ncbi:MAG: response regulator [Desulfamplus sp.]|nr:response regulator [Desulfamplus sp.]
MKKVTQILILFFLLFPLSIICSPTRSSALDYLVDFIAENYKETEIAGAGSPKIYHTLQVNTELGSRVLMLEGDDLDYRIWLRQYLSTAKQLIITVPDDQVSLFKNSKLFQIDVTLVNPLSGSDWKNVELPPVIEEPPPKEPYKGKKHILVVDDDPKKRSLIEMVITKLGYPVTLAANSYDALEIFRKQPDKFNLVIADGGIHKGVSSASLVKNILETSSEINIILGTGYKDEKITAMFTDFFAGISRVIIKPLVLKELPKTILQVLEKKI